MGLSSGDSFTRAIESLTMTYEQAVPARTSRLDSKKRDASDPNAWTCKCGQVNYRRDMFSTGNRCLKCSAPRPSTQSDLEWSEVCKMYNEKKKRKRKKSSYSSSSDSSSSHSRGRNKRARNR